MSSVAIKRAPALRAGDRIRLVAPASPFDRKLFERGVKALERLGFRPLFDRAEYKRDGFLAGGDRERAARLRRALLEPESRAVWCIRGGYGTARLLGHLDLPRLRKRPKVLVGFSDVSALLLNLSVPGGYITFHGPVITQLGSVPAAAQNWLVRLAQTATAGGRVPLGRVRTLTRGKAGGRLIGGNLSVLTSLVGTPYIPKLAGAILFIEDTGEEAYRLDRLFTQLGQAGVLAGVRGVVLGSLYGCVPAGGGRHAARTVLERAVTGLGVPAISGASFGHIPRNLALPMGVAASLNATTGVLTVSEPAVR
jgi:muramoyltetrapeptide carboxypeptidase